MSRACFRATRPDMSLTPAEACAPFDPVKAIRPNGYVSCRGCGEPSRDVLCGARECAVVYRAQVRDADRLAADLARAAAEEAAS